MAGAEKVLEFGPLFRGLCMALADHTGACGRCVMREVGRQLGKIFVQELLSLGKLERGISGIELFFQVYCRRELGDFKIVCLDLDQPFVEIRVLKAPARGEKKPWPPQACEAFAGLIEAVFAELAEEKFDPRQTLLCKELACRVAGADDCHYVIGSWKDLAELQGYLQKHQHPPFWRNRTEEVKPNLPISALCGVFWKNKELESTVVGLSERLSMSQRLLESLLESSADAILAVDEQHKILTWNRGAELIYGCKAHEVLGKSFEMFVPQDLLERDELGLIGQAIRQSDYLWHYETERVTRNGRRIVIDLTCSAIRDEKGQFLGCSSIARDITEKKRLQKDLLLSEKLSAIGTMSAHVAHEVRNPLSSIRLNLELLGDELVEGGNLAEAHTLLSAIQAEVEVLTQFTDEVLQFARLPNFSFETLELEQLVQELISFICEEAERRRIGIETRFSATVPPVQGDGHKLRQVLLNLSRNAMEAMPEGGQLILEVRRDGKDVEIRVQDTGKGIAPEVLPKIFEPFFTTKTSGTGLGLALSQQIIHEHGGSLSCTSPLGGGCTFVVRLPGVAV